MSGRGKKVKEVITIRGTFDGGGLDDLGGEYLSVDDAVKDARKIYKNYSRTKEDRRIYKNLDVSVCFGEFEYESGDVYGEPTCLSIKDLKPSRQKEHTEKKKPYYISEPFGLPFELTEKDKFRKLKKD